MLKDTNIKAVIIAYVNALDLEIRRCKNTEMLVH